MKTFFICLFLMMGFILGTTQKAKAQIPTTDIVQVLENAFGISIEGTELVQDYNDIIAQFEQLKQEMAQTDELKQIIELKKVINPLIVNSYFGDPMAFQQFLGQQSGNPLDYITQTFELMGDCQGEALSCTLESMFGASGFESVDLNAFFNLLDQNKNVEALQADGIDDLNGIYSDYYYVQKGMNEFSDKKKLQLAQHYFEMSGDFQAKADEIAVLIDPDNTVVSDFLPQELNLDLISLTNIFKSLNIIGLFDDVADNEEEEEGGLILNVINFLTEDFYEDLEMEDLPEIEGLGLGNLDLSGIKDKIFGLVQTVGNIVNLLDLDTDISSILSIPEEEPAVKLSDFERMEMLDKQNEYLAKSVEYHEKAVDLIQEASQGSEQDRQERQTIVRQKIGQQLAQSFLLSTSF